MNPARLFGRRHLPGLHRWILKSSIRDVQTASLETTGSEDKFSFDISEPDKNIDQSAPTKDDGKPTVKSFLDHEDPFGVYDMVTVKDLFKARVHLGHHAGCWSRYVRPYLYGIRNGIHIFNLETTLANLHRALNVVGHMAYQRSAILFVNERAQFEALTQFTARECNEYYVTKWRPGTLTNSYMLLKTMRVPDLIIFLSVPRSKTAVKEALTQGIPNVGIVDSDCNPNFMLYPVPGNDDSLQAMQLYCELFKEVIIRAKMLRARDERALLKQKEEMRQTELKMQEDKAEEINTELQSLSGND